MKRLFHADFLFLQVAKDTMRRTYFVPFVTRLHKLCFLYLVYKNIYITCIYCQINYNYV